jgi:hypothetical protein
MKFTKIITILIILSSCVKQTSFAQFEQINEIKKDFSKLGGKISNEEAAEIIEKLYNEKVINEEGKRQFLGFAKDRVFPKFLIRPEIDTTKLGQALAKAGMFVPLIFGADTTHINRNILMVMIGYLDFIKAKPNPNMGVSSNKMADKLFNLKDKINPIFGEKWAFNVEFDGNLENPFSIKYDLNKTRNNYYSLLESFNKVGLIDKKVYDDTRAWLIRDEVLVLKDFSPLLYAALRGIYYDIYPVLKGKQTSLIDSLDKANLITTIDAQKLKSQLNNYTLLSKTDIFRKIKNSQFINIDDYKSNDKTAALTELYGKIAKIIPDTKISAITINKLNRDLASSQRKGSDLINMQKIEEFMNPSLIELNVKLNGKTYKKEQENIEIKEGKIKAELPNYITKLINDAQLVQNKDIQIINDFLADNGKKQRLFMIGNGLGMFPKPKFNEKVLVLLDSTQYEIVMASMPLAKFVNETKFDENNSLSAFQKIYDGLFSEKIISKIDEPKLEEIIINSRKSGKPTEYLATFNETLLKQNPLNITKLDFVNERKLKGTFEEFLNKISTISKGSFKPIEVQSNFASEIKKGEKEDKFFKFGFKVNGYLYSDSLQINYLNEEGDENIFNKMTNDDNYNQIQNKIMGLINTASSNEYRPFQYVGTEKYCIYLPTKRFYEINSKLNNMFTELDLGLTSSTVVEEVIDTTEEAFDAPTYLEELKAIDLIDEEGIEKANLASIYGIKSKQSLFPFLKNTLTFNVFENIKKTRNQYFTDYYKAIQKKFLPNVALSNLVVTSDSTIVNYDEPEESYTNHFVNVSYTINGQNYMDYHQNFDSFKQNNLNLGSESFNIYSLNISPIFNNYLTDIQSKQRLVYQLDAQNIYITSTNNVQNNFLEMSNFDAPTIKTINAEITKLVDLKLIKKLPPKELDKAINEYRNTFGGLSALSLLYNFKSDNLATFNAIMNFEKEKTYWPNTINKLLKDDLVFTDFKDNLKSFIKAREAEFNKEDNFKSNLSYEGSYKVNNVISTFKIDTERDYEYGITLIKLYEGTISKLNKALKTSNKPNRIYLYGDSYLLYLNNQQREYLISKDIELTPIEY